jgi:hypothetical protein
VHPRARLGSINRPGGDSTSSRRLEPVEVLIADASTKAALRRRGQSLTADDDRSRSRLSLSLPRVMRSAGVSRCKAPERGSSVEFHGWPPDDDSCIRQSCISLSLSLSLFFLRPDRLAGTRRSGANFFLSCSIVSELTSCIRGAQRGGLARKASR